MRRGLVVALVVGVGALASGVLSACASDLMCEQSCSASYECGPGLSCFGGQCLPTRCTTCASRCNYSNAEGVCEFTECR